MRSWKDIRLFGAVYVILCMLIVINMNRHYSDDPITSDAAQNLTMSYNLYVYNIISSNSEVINIPRPTNYREPVPPIFNALYMHLHPVITKEASLDSFLDGENTIRIKKANLFWVFFLLIGLGLIIFKLTENRFFTLLLLILVYFYFIRFGNHFQSLYTELQAACLIIWTSYFLLLSAINKTSINYLLAGLFLGLLILTKAVFYYLSIFIALFIVIDCYYGAKRLPWAKICVQSGIFILGIFLVVAPWLIRNKIHFDEYQITQRGGIVLHYRAMKNQMTNEEVVGAIHFFGPELYKSISGKVFNIKEDDFEVGGRFERVKRSHEIDSIARSEGNPELAVSFYGITRAKRSELIYHYASLGYEESFRKADEDLWNEAKQVIKVNPVKHILMTGVFLWRGMWCFPNSTIPLIGIKLQSYTNNLINLLSYISLFGIFLVSIYRKDFILISVTLFSVLMIVFHATLTNGIQRFNEPTIPVLLISLIIVLNLIFESQKNKFYMKKTISS